MDEPDPLADRGARLPARLAEDRHAGLGGPVGETASVVTATRGSSRRIASSKPDRVSAVSPEWLAATISVRDPAPPGRP